MAATGIQATIYSGYGQAAAALQAPVYTAYRPVAGESNPTAGTPIASLPAQFTNAKLTGYNFDRAVMYDDVGWSALIDGTNLLLGDYLVGPNGTYIIIGMQPMLPIICILANRSGTLTRSLSELSVGGGLGSAGPGRFGGSTPYFGRREDAADNTAGITAPVYMLASAGRATSRSEFASAAPGPARYRVYLSAGTFPKGSISDRDYVTDEEGNRHIVEAAGWTLNGYRLETIREEI